MALTRPSIDLIKVKDATKSFDVTFRSTGGNQIISNQIVICRNDTQAVVLTQKVTSFSFVNTVAGNVLSNGTQYKIVLTTFDKDGNQSTGSEPILFYCYKDMVVTIPNIIDGKINNQTYNFQGAVSGTNIDILESYRYIIYDSTQTTIQSFLEVYNQSLLQPIAGNENGITYYLELLVSSQHGGYYTSGLIKFTPDYIVPRVAGALTLNNKSELAAVEIIAKVTQIIGTIVSGSATYINGNTYLDLKTGNQTVSFQEGLVLDKNFDLKIYLPLGLEDNIIFLKIVCSIGYVNFIKYNNRIHAFVYVIGSTLVDHFASPVLIMGNTDNLVIWAQRINDNMDLQVQKII